MARKPDPDSVAFLKRQVTELVAVNEALSEKLAAFVADHEATVAELTEAVQVVEQERDQFRGWWHDERKKVDGAQAEAKEARTQRDNYRLQFESDRDLRLNAERERDLARAHADTMRRLAYPDGPEFPWEKQRPGDGATFHYVPGIPTNDRFGSGR